MQRDARIRILTVRNVLCASFTRRRFSSTLFLCSIAAAAARCSFSFFLFSPKMRAATSTKAPATAAGTGVAKCAMMATRTATANAHSCKASKLEECICYFLPTIGHNDDAPLVHLVGKVAGLGFDVPSEIKMVNRNILRSFNETNRILVSHEGVYLFDVQPPPEMIAQAEAVATHFG